VYTVKQAAEKMGISAHTLRFYDKEGLFPHVSRDADLEWVHTVQCMRETGMPIAEVKEYVRLGLLGNSTIPTRYQMVQNLVQQAEQERAALEDRINTLKRKVDYYNRLVAEQEADDQPAMNQARTMD
jgi:DNA-binding transcriptional MerR regulator